LLGFFRLKRRNNILFFVLNNNECRCILKASNTFVKKTVIFKYDLAIKKRLYKLIINNRMQKNLAYLSNILIKYSILIFDVFNPRL